MREQYTRVRVDVRVGVLGLAVLGEYRGHHLEHGVHKLKELVLGHVLESEGALAHVPRVGLAQYGVAVAGDHLARLERLPREVSDALGRDGLALLLERRLQPEQPSEDLLVGEAVERAGERVHRRGEREVWVGERGADEVARVRRGVAALVVGVDRNVQTHQLVEAGVIEPEHLAEVARVIERRVVRRDNAVKVRLAVDDRAHLGQAREQIEHVLVRVLPVQRLVRALRILLREDGLSLQREDRRRQLRHRVHAFRECPDHRLNVGWQLGARVEVGGERSGLILGGNLAGQQEP
mmetsp:Transcript_942/g.2557  ORF Transcript_942/g.2557 Transcript_942/m.2557 type:complete len:294 (+) Transcript_942:566-1447(+)